MLDALEQVVAALGVEQAKKELLAMQVRRAVERLDAADAEEGLLESARSGTVTVEESGVVEGGGGFGTGHADGAAQHDARGKDVGAEGTGRSRDEAIGIVEQGERCVERWCVWSARHGIRSRTRGEGRLIDGNGATRGQA